MRKQDQAYKPLDKMTERDALERVGQAQRAASTLATWLTMVEAGRELDGDGPLSDDEIALSYVGNGASIMVTIGDIRALLRARKGGE